MGFSRQEYWSSLPFLSPVDHILPELSTITRLSWVTLQGMADSFIEWHKAVIHVIILVSFLCGHGIAVLVSTVGSLMDEDKRLVQSFLMGGTGYGGWGGQKKKKNLGFALVFRTMLSKSLIQFYATRWDCALSLQLGLRWPSPGACSLYVGL